MGAFPGRSTWYGASSMYSFKGITLGAEEAEEKTGC